MEILDFSLGILDLRCPSNFALAAAQQKVGLDKFKNQPIKANKNLGNSRFWLRNSRILLRNSLWEFSLGILTRAVLWTSQQWQKAREF